MSPITITTSPPTGKTESIAAWKIILAGMLLFAGMLIFVSILSLFIASIHETPFRIVGSFLWSIFTSNGLVRLLLHVLN